jgi:hypothetical protein
LLFVGGAIHFLSLKIEDKDYLLSDFLVDGDIMQSHSGHAVHQAWQPVSSMDSVGGLQGKKRGQPENFSVRTCDRPGSAITYKLVHSTLRLSLSSNISSHYL